MANTNFPLLFSPITLAPGLELKNRIVMAPMATNFADEYGSPTENQVAYYRLRARKSVALIVTESNYVRDDGKNGPTRMGLHGDHVLPAHKRLTQTVHEEGGKVCAQLHFGGYTVGPNLIGRLPLSCSAIPLDTKGEPGVGLIPRKMDANDIKELVGCYAAAAVRAREAGYDAIQIHCAHGYLLNTFLSPHTNKRTDQYGGSDENRLRIVVEIFEAVRKAIGNTFPMSVRFSGEETMDGGYTSDFIVYAIKQLLRFNIYEANISGGNYEQAEKIAPPYWYPLGYYAPVASRIRKQVKLPISTVGRIINPECAEALLARGDADLVYIGRELVAFPFFAEAAAKGQPIKECCGCNCCFHSMAKGEGLVCMVNPFIGRDAMVLQTDSVGYHRTGPAKRIAVIGAGPAGLTAATEAAARGHSVKLYERAPAIGGKLKRAGSLVEGKQVLLRLIPYLEGKAREAGVEIICGKEITEASQLDRPDLVIVATGAVEKTIAIPGLQKCLSAEAAMNDLDALGKRVVVIGGGMVGAELAEALASRGKEVSIVEMLDDILIGYEFPNKRGVIQRLCDLGVWIYLSSTITGADEQALTIKFKNRTFALPYDTVVSATGYAPQPFLKEALQRSGLEVVAIGDCASPGKILHATRAAIEAIDGLDAPSARAASARS
jgi:2,4-dienoyl-CoA reductase-like NADH-dependent reductase (Old Yellow Enzyme family)/thioredoxin reductase